MPSRRSVLFVLAILSVALCWKALPAQEQPPSDPGLFEGMKWRSVGPHRASRTVAAAGQESGSVCVSSRGNYGAISVRDWLPVGVDEYGYVAPDPLNPDIVYGGRTVSRFDRRTGQVSAVGPVAGRGGGPGATGNFRQVRTMPVVFSEVDKRSLFFANNHLWKTVDGGQAWKQISPDLTRKTWDIPGSVGKYRPLPGSQPAERGVIYTVAPSYQDIQRIWAGTDDGLIHVTADGGATWKDVTPPQVTAWAKVSLIDAGRFNPATAYAAINTLRLDDLRPHILRTHDGGATWTEIVGGIPAGETVNAVREDPKKKGLLFAATERAVYVSFDDGVRWQTLRLNMPVSSVRDITIKDDDLVAATHGRGFWILDDITVLRQIGPSTHEEDAVLFAPTVNGKTLTQPLTVRQDPRVKTPTVTMQQVYSLTNALYVGAADAHAAAVTAGSWREQASRIRASANGEVATALDAFGQKAAMLAGTPPSAGGGRGGGRGGGGAAAPAASATVPEAETLWAVRSQLSGLMNSMQAADVAPTANTLAAVATARATASRVMARWNGLRTVELPALNARLKAAGLGQIG